jgi:thiamine-phosphate pyrophosphorylase
MYQFSTSEYSERSAVSQATSAIEGGCKWIRLSGRQQSATIEQIIPLCQQADAILILDDDIELVDKLRVHGVHLTQWNRGMLIATREKLGPHAIIGITCQTPEAIEQLQGLDIDYMVIPTTDVSDITAYFTPFIEKLNAINSDIHPVAAGDIPVSLRQAVLATGIEGIEINESWNL